MTQMFCPKCRKEVYVEEHVYGDRTEYICSICGFRIRVIHHDRYLFYPPEPPLPRRRRPNPWLMEGPWL